MDDLGVFYIATGEQFVEEAKSSAKSIRSAMPDTPIAIATDIEPDFGFDKVINIEQPEYGFSDQISNLHRSPFRETIHLDTDIYIDSDVSGLFNLLSQFDIGAAYNHNREAYRLPKIPNSFPEYNTGVIVYRNDENFRQFTRSWKENYTELTSEENIQNQPSFRKTLFESSLRIATLTPEYNCMVRYPGHVRNRVKIAHSRLLDIQTPGAGKSVDVVKATEKLNRYDGHRLYLPNNRSGVSILYARDEPLYKKAVNSIRQQGIGYTTKRGMEIISKYFRNIRK
ncbi:hypothetical protein [Halobacterium salinarum]|uniref:hypothetical protein n=1 Tax=Halobacterium salinarum TaxID=2242 RepID=UPI002555FDB2|nr:hypothetical protein [Halobacterium salinarum]MDL0121726.1 hypothetical protein [Halobacterium salinarum]